eukprot:10718656-Ditylum_brightwellii.AAC.1
MHTPLCGCSPGFDPWVGRSGVCNSSNPGEYQILDYMAAVDKSPTLYKGGEEGAHMLPGVQPSFRDGIWWSGTQGGPLVIRDDP